MLSVLICIMKKITLIIVTGAMLLSFVACNNSNDNSNIDSRKKEIDSITIITQKIKEDTLNADLYHTRSHLYLDKKNFNKALRDIGKAIQYAPDNDNHLVLLSDIYYASESYENARGLLKRIHKNNPDNIVTSLKLAKLEIAYRHYEEAHRLLNSVLKIDEKNYVAYDLKGIIYKEQGKKDLAIESFKKSLMYNDKYEDVYIQLGMLYSEKNDADAIDYFKGALNINSDNVNALYLLGVFYQKNYDMDKAEETYKKIIALDSANQYAYYNLGYINLVFHEDFEKAIVLFKKAIEVDSNYLEAYYNLGYSYELNSDFINARIYYKKVLKMDKDYQKAIEGLSRLDNVM